MGYPAEQMFVKQSVCESPPSHPTLTIKQKLLFGVVLPVLVAVTLAVLVIFPLTWIRKPDSGWVGMAMLFTLPRTLLVAVIVDLWVLFPRWKNRWLLFGAGTVAPVLLYWIALSSPAPFQWFR